LTLAEAAAFLRVNPADLLHLVQTDGLPGRQFGAEWRFLKTALQNWLIKPLTTKSAFWGKHFGALKDDPYLDEMLENIYKARGRPMAEAG
jgi:hypothetical protein